MLRIATLLSHRTKKFQPETAKHLQDRVLVGRSQPFFWQRAETRMIDYIEPHAGKM
jgi:hypothetical protein